jgi:hypothetical protein
MAVPTSGTRNILRILDETGDTELSFDPNDQASVLEVEQRFNELMRRNFVAFDVTTQPGRIIRTFDPNAREVIVSHQFSGG